MVVKKENKDASIPPEGEAPLKKRIEYDDLYRRSSQYNVWSFTEQELIQRREKVNQKGREMALEKSRQVINPQTGELEQFSNFETLQIGEELKIIAYYARRAIGLSNLFKMPSQVRGTLISYLKRFYLNHSVMEYHPKNVMLTCLFLLAKAENYFIGIKTFASKINNTLPENILKYEYLVIQSLEFTLMVHHPFRSLYGFYLDIQAVLPKIDKKKIGASYDKTKELINESLISDVAFLFTPPQIALLCWRKVNKELIDRYLKRKFGSSNHTAKASSMSPIKEEDEDGSSSSVTPPTQSQPDQLTKLLEVLDKCQTSLDKAYDPGMEESKIIDKKVHYCINPAKLLKRKRDASATATATPSLPEGAPELKKPKLE